MSRQQQALIAASDRDAERAILGTMLVYREAIEPALGALREEHFTLTAHRLIFQAISRMWGRHEADIDTTAIASELEVMGKLPEPVRRESLSGFLDWAGLPQMLPRYVEPVLRCHFQRLLHRGAETLLQIAADAELTREEMAGRADVAIQEVTKEGASASRIADIADVVLETARHLGERDARRQDVTGVPFGIPALDHRTNGWQAGELTVIGALPGGGKTAFACQAAVEAAMDGIPVLLFSLEMSARQLVQRVVANLARVDGLRMERGQLGAGERERRDSALDRLADLPIRIDPNPEASPSYLLAACRAEGTPPGLVIVDYVGLMQPDGKVDNENAREMSIMRGLKRAAKSLEVPLMVMSQFRKTAAGEARKGRRLDDLYGSRSMSAEPACVVYLDTASNEAQEPEGEPDFTKPRRVVAEVAKNRYGGTGRIPMWWTPAYVRFDAGTAYPGGG